MSKRAPEWERWERELDEQRDQRDPLHTARGIVNGLLFALALMGLLLLGYWAVVQWWLV